MKFRYTKSKSQPSGAFPQGISIFRPIINIAIKYRDKRLRVFALLDTGADYCLIPQWIGEKLGITIPDGKKLPYRGAAGGTQIAHLHNVILEIGGWNHECCAGFIYEADEDLPFMLLGTVGFFESYEVTFNLAKNEIKMEKT